MAINKTGQVKNAVVTPTFKGHFPKIEKLLESAGRFVLDKKVHFYFVVEASDRDELEGIVSPYSGSLNATVVSFEECLSAFDIDTAPEELLRKYDKFTYQTLKKFYGMLHINADRFLVLDSESMFIRPTALADMFDEYFADPFLVVSRLSSRSAVAPLSLNATLNGASIVKAAPTIWTLETFHWFYSTSILRELVGAHGMPIEWAAAMHLSRGADQHIFEVVVYYLYLAKHAERLNYRLLYVEDLLKDNLSSSTKASYEKQLQNTAPWQDGGMMEHFLLFLTLENASGFLKICDALPASILRCDTSAGRAGAQADFLNRARGVRILAASQDHAFGVNNSLWRYLESNRSTLIERTRQAKSDWRYWPAAAVSALALTRNALRYARVKPQLDKVGRTSPLGQRTAGR